MIDLQKLSDEEIVGFIQINKYTEKCLKILIDNHSGICIDMINSFLSTNFNETLRREMINEKDYHIYQAALKFDSTKGSKFSTYLANEVKWKCLNAYNKIKRQKTTPVEENLINYFSYYSKDPNESNLDNDIFSAIIDKTKEHPDKRVERIFHLRYVVGKNNSVMPWKYISKDIGMSIQGCINIHDAIIKNMKFKINKKIYE